MSFHEGSVHNTEGSVHNTEGSVHNTEGSGRWGGRVVVEKGGVVSVFIVT